METYKVNQTGPQVQEALNKALTAYQKPENGIPESDFSSAVQQKIDGAYVKPQNGIPATDLTENVQQRLNEALNHAYSNIKAYATFNSSTGKYDLTPVLLPLFQAIRGNWKKKILQVVSLIRPAQGQLPEHPWQSIPVYPSGDSDEPTKFVGSIMHDETTMLFVSITQDECYAIEITI